MPFCKWTLTYHDLMTILDPQGIAPLPQAHRSMVKFAARTARDPNAVTDDDFIALEVAGIDDPQILELLSVRDLAMMFDCDGEPAQV